MNVNEDNSNISCLSLDYTREPAVSRTSQRQHNQQLRQRRGAGKDDSNDDELGTDSIHAVFTDKSYVKRCGTSCDELDLPCRVVLKAAWDQRHMIHHVIGFIQIPGSLPIINYTLWLSYYEVPVFEVLSYAKYFVSVSIKNIF